MGLHVTMSNCVLRELPHSAGSQSLTVVHAMQQRGSRHAICRVMGCAASDCGIPAALYNGHVQQRSNRRCKGE